MRSAVLKFVIAAAGPAAVLKNLGTRAFVEGVDQCGLKLRTPNSVEKPWSDLAPTRRTFLPLLGAPLSHRMGERETESGERVGVRAGFSIHHSSLSGTIQGMESGILRH